MATAIGSRYHVGNTSSRKNTEVKQGLDVDPVLVPTNTVKSQKRRNGRKKRIKCKLILFSARCNVTCVINNKIMQNVTFAKFLLKIVRVEIS